MHPRASHRAAAPLLRILPLAVVVVLSLTLPARFTRADMAAGVQPVSVQDFVGPGGTVNLEALTTSGQEGPVDLGSLAGRLCATDAGLVLDRSASPMQSLAENDENWADGFGAPGATGNLNGGAAGTVGSVTIWNGQLVAAGNFGSIGGVPSAGVAAWNGSAWVDLGATPNYTPGGVTVYDGALICSYDNGIYRYDGSAWTSLGVPGSINTHIYALAVYNGNLIVGGSFQSIAGVAAANIARWDGATWNPLGTGTNSTVSALTVYGPQLIAGGSFTQAGGVTASGIAAWNGYVWSPLGTGANSTVSALTVHGSQLIAGGSFTQAGGVTAGRIAAWNGSAWSALGTGMSGNVYSLVSHSGLLVAGGAFTTSGGVTTNGIATWNGSIWTALGTGLGTASGTGTAGAYALNSYDGVLSVGGNFAYAGSALANGIAQWNGTAWSCLDSSKGANGVIRALLRDGASLYAAGDFYGMGGAPPRANRVAMWASGAWTNLGTGLDQPAYALTTYGGSLVVGGSLTQAGGNAASRIARWNGTSWSALGSGMNNTVRALTVYNGELVAGGDFTQAGGQPAYYIAKWNGTAWAPVGSGLDGAVRALVVYDGRLVAGGAFTYAGTGNAAHVAAWDGTSWSPLGSGVTDGSVIVNALAVHNGRLIAAGGFTTAGGVSANRIANWDGSAWSPLGPGFGAEVQTLASFAGRLYAGGDFGGLYVDGSYVANWDGSLWRPLGSGPNATCRALASDSAYLYVGGDFTTAGGKQSAYFGRWNPVTGPCTLTATAPAGGIEVCKGYSLQIAWDHSVECGGDVRIDLLHEGALCRSIAPTASNTGTYSWTAEQASGWSEGYSIAITDLQSGLADTTAGTFRILPPPGPQFTYPGPGDTLRAGCPVQVRWSTSQCNRSGYVYLALLRNGSLCHDLTNSFVPDSGSLTWTVSGCDTATAGYRLVIRDNSYRCDTTDASFYIVPGGQVTVTSPNGGETLVAGNHAEIAWSQSGCAGSTVYLQLLQHSSVCRYIGSVPNTGSASWTVLGCGADSTGYTIRVTDAVTGAWDESDAPFVIRNRFAIASIADVGNDQGRHVRVRWLSHENDVTQGTPKITLYSLWRRIDEPQELSLSPGSGPGGLRNYPSSLAATQLAGFPAGGWDFVSLIPASGEAEYSTVSETLCDSTLAQGMCWSVFFMRAHTADPVVYYDCSVDSGYSIDNLAPAAPGNLRFTTATLLAWDESNAPDFDYFAVYGSNGAGLDSTAVLLGNTTGTTRDVSAEPFTHYHVVATDFSGNAGAAASIANPAVTGVQESVLPVRFALHAPMPNPTASGAVLSFDLPQDGRVTLRLFDAGGRSVATLVDGYLPAGSHTVAWRGADERGRRVGTGMYFCRMEAARFSQTRKIVVAR